MDRDSDDSLVARLNALKAGSGTFTSAPEGNAASTDTQPIPDDLASRFRTLAGRDAVAVQKSTYNLQDVETQSGHDDLESAFAEGLEGSEDIKNWAEGLEEENVKIDAVEMKRLMDEARALLKEKEKKDTVGGEDSRKGVQDGKSGGVASVDVEVFKPEGNDDSQLENEEEEADEYVRKLLEEVEFEKSLGKEAEEKDEDPEEKPRKESSSTKITKVPQKKPDDDTEAAGGKTDEDLSSRFASLSLPSVPSTAPETKSNKPPGFSDDDIDSWCIICFADSSIKCLGCDGDLYCATCWREGHRGESAGWEEKRHKAVQWRKSDGGVMV